MNVRGMLAALAVGTALGWWTEAARADDYRIGKEDVLAISVWLHPELERSATVNADGKIVFPPVGEIQADGLTAKELGVRIAERLGSYLRQPTQVTVTVSQFNSRVLFVNGAVARPGKYGFESLPGLVEVIGTAGGATPGADLSQVQIIRREGTARRTLVADVAAAMRSESEAVLPELRPGDTIVVPAALTGAGAATSAGEVVAVLGEVQKPGLYGVGQGQDILQVISQAGGATPRANLRRVRVVGRTGGAQTVFTVDVRNTIEHGAAHPFVVRPGDVVVIDPSGASAAARGWGGFTSLLSTARDMLSVALLIDLVNSGGTNRNP